MSPWYKLTSWDYEIHSRVYGAHDLPPFHTLKDNVILKRSILQLQWACNIQKLVLIQLFNTTINTTISSLEEKCSIIAI